MKKNIILTALAALSLCLTACGTDAGGTQTNTAAQTTAAQTTAAETTAAQTTAVQTTAAETTAAQTTAAETTTAQTTAAVTTAAQTTAAQTTKAAAKKITVNESESLFGGYADTKDNANLNLRAEPNEKAEILAKIPCATQLNIYACDTKGWYITKYRDKVGYVSAEYIKEIPASDMGAPDNATPNKEGFYDVNDLPASSISVAALNGKWANEQGDVFLEITDGGDIYHGKFTLLDQGNVTHTGNVQIQYLVDQVGVREYCFTFYEDDGTFMFALDVTNTIQLTDLYGYQSGEPHFIRQAD